MTAIIVIATALAMSFVLGFEYGSRAAFRAMRKLLEEQRQAAAVSAVVSAADGGPHA